MVVPLLPTSDIEEGFLLLIDSMKDVITMEDIKSCDVFRKVNENVKEFCSYIQNYWMRPSNMNQLSCYLNEKRTNNPQESWHEVLKKLIKSKNPHISEFMGKFILKINNSTLHASDLAAVFSQILVCKKNLF